METEEKTKRKFKPKKIEKKDNQLIPTSNVNNSAAANQNDKKEGGKAAEESGVKSKKPIKFLKKCSGIDIIRYHAHWGWITKLKYIEDLQSILSSSLDGFIHMHDLENFDYKRKTFNLH